MGGHFSLSHQDENSHLFSWEITRLNDNNRYQCVIISGISDSLCFEAQNLAFCGHNNLVFNDRIMDSYGKF